jgi:hypothetical protein
MNDDLDRRLREGLQEAAAFEPDTAAARTRFDRRRHGRRLRLWTGTGVLAAAGVAALAFALAGSAGSGSRVGLTATGQPRGQDATSTTTQPVAGAPGNAPGSPASTANAPGVTAHPGGTVVGTPATVHPSPKPTSAPTTVPETAPPGPGPHTITVTEADSRKSYTLQRGDTLVVQLSGSSGYPWTEPSSSNGSVLHHTGGSTASDGSATATFSASADGQADVSATENATCATSTPRCMIASKAFDVSVTVVG